MTGSRGRGLGHAPRRGQNDDGSAAIEAVILFPLVLALVMTVFQAAVYYHARDAARWAANSGAVVGAVRDGSAAEAETEARSRIERAGGSTLLDDYSVAATHDGAQVVVLVEGHAKTFVPGLPPLKVTQSVAAPVERFTTS